MIFPPRRSSMVNSEDKLDEDPEFCYASTALSSIERVPKGATTAETIIDKCKLLRSDEYTEIVSSTTRCAPSSGNYLFYSLPLLTSSPFLFYHKDFSSFIFSLSFVISPFLFHDRVKIAYYDPVFSRPSVSRPRDRRESVHLRL